jgi:hypothetical protein
MNINKSDGIKAEEGRRKKGNKEEQQRNRETDRNRDRDRDRDRDRESTDQYQFVPGRRHYRQDSNE